MTDSYWFSQAEILVHFDLVLCVKPLPAFSILLAELRTSLEEHQSALELIMSKYREQMFRLLMASKKDDPSIIMKLKDQHSKVIASLRFFTLFFS